MADDQITIRIPGASPPVPEVVIDCFPSGERLYQESALGRAEIAGFSAVGTPIINSSLVDRFAMTVLAIMPELDALRLGAIAKWSSTEYGAGRDGALELDFELEYIDPSPTGHGITLIQTLTTSYGYEYGFPRYRVGLTLPSDYRRRYGVASDGINSLVQFSVLEVG